MVFGFLCIPLDGFDIEYLLVAYFYFKLYRSVDLEEVFIRIDFGECAFLEETIVDIHEEVFLLDCPFQFLLTQTYLLIDFRIDFLKENDIGFGFLVYFGELSDPFLPFLPVLHLNNIIVWLIRQI